MMTIKHFAHLLAYIILSFVFILLNGISLQAQDWKFKQSVDSMVDSKMLASSAPGMAICISYHGRIVYEKQVGLANVKKNIPITNQTRFNIGSVSKQFTAACIYILEERGLLNRTDSIQKYVPELPSFGSTITINHLLAHTSGLTDHMEVLGLQNKFTSKRLTPKYVFQFFKQAPVLSFKPGERFSYCNTGYMLLAMIVEKVSGKSLSEFTRVNLFEPLKMNSTMYTNDELTGMPDGTMSYYLSGKKYKRVKHPQRSAMGATGVFSTLRDMAIWHSTFDLDENGFAQKEFNRHMQTSFQLNDGSSVNYGGGLILKSYKGHRNIEHSGGWNEFLTQFRHLPYEGYSILIATNTTAISPFGICDEISDLLLLSNRMNGFTPSNLSKTTYSPTYFTGKYIDANNVVRTICYHQDTLTITNLSNNKKALAYMSFQKAINDSLLYFKDDAGDSILVLMNAQQSVKGFYWEGGHYFRFKRYYKKLEDSSSANLQNFEGRYYASQYDQGFRIKKKHGLLKMYPVFFKGYQLQALGSDVYKVKNESIYLRFKPDGLTIGNDWISELHLNKIR